MHDPVFDASYTICDFIVVSKATMMQIDHTTKRLCLGDYYLRKAPK